MVKLPVALQLYSLREAIKDDFVGVIEQVSKMGYAGVEFAGFGGMQAGELSKVLSDLGLDPVGAHIGYYELKNSLPRVVDFSLELGLSYVVCPGGPQEKIATVDDWKMFADQMQIIAKKLHENGLNLAYHNHSWELERFDGHYGLDVFCSEAPDVQLEIDLGWVLFAGVDPVAYLKEKGGRCPLVHVKDFTADKKQIEVGFGTLDLGAVVSIAQQVGVKWLILETEEYTISPEQSVKIGLDNILRAMNGEGYGGNQIM